MRTDHFQESVSQYLRTDVPIFHSTRKVQSVIEAIRAAPSIGEQIHYFYVIDDEGRLVGVVPARQLLLASAETQIGEIALRRVITVPVSATLADACEFFILYKLLALPVVDQQGKFLGIVDVGVFTDEAFNLSEKQEADNVFQWIGVRVGQLQNVSPFEAFRYRFPWLTATITSGLACALITAFYETTLARAITLAAFLTVVLGLGESVAVQAMTVTVQSLHGKQISFWDLVKRVRRELLTALMLGASCGMIVGSIALVWRRDLMVSLAIGCGIFLSVTMAGVTGMLVPALLHVARRDPKIAAGPIALALADILTLTFYFSAARLLLGS